MQPFRKKRLEHSAVANACTDIVVKSVNIHRLRTLFHRLPPKRVDEQLCRWKLLIGTNLQQSFIISEWKIRFSRFRAQNEGEGVKMGAHFGVV